MAEETLKDLTPKELAQGKRASELLRRYKTDGSTEAEDDELLRISHWWHPGMLCAVAQIERQQAALAAKDAEIARLTPKSEVASVDTAENTTSNPKSWIAWKRRCEIAESELAAKDAEMARLTACEEPISTIDFTYTTEDLCAWADRNERYAVMLRRGRISEGRSHDQAAAIYRRAAIGIVELGQAKAELVATRVALDTAKAEIARLHDALLDSAEEEYLHGRRRYETCRHWNRYDGTDRGECLNRPACGVSSWEKSESCSAWTPKETK